MSYRENTTHVVIKLMKFYGAVIAVVFGSIALAIIATSHLTLEFVTLLNNTSDVPPESMKFFYLRLYKLGIDPAYYMLGRRLLLGLSILALALSIVTIKSEKKLYPAITCLCCAIILYLNIGLSTYAFGGMLLGASLALIAPQKAKDNASQRTDAAQIENTQ